MQVFSFDGKQLISTLNKTKGGLSRQEVDLTGKVTGDQESTYGLVSGVGYAGAEDSLEMLELPIIGGVAAGVPIEAIAQSDACVRVPAHLFREKPTYLLRVKGDSMIEAGIHEGDLIAIKKTEKAEEGSFIVARIGDEVTVKELEVRDGQPVLLPHNSKYEPMFVAPEEFVVEGVFVGLVRNSSLH